MLSLPCFRGLMPLFLALPWLAACGDADRSPAEGTQAVARIEGQVLYRERMMLPPGCRVEVQLQDISRADAMATVLESVTIEAQGGPPYPFAIEYDPARIDPRMRYALRATITSGDRLLFTNTEYIDPFTGNPVEVLVRRTAEPVRAREAPLEETVWVLDTLGGEPAPAGAGGRPVDLQLNAAERRAAGFAGCNRYTGAYVREEASPRGAALGFGDMAVTLMACAEGGELERTYLDMLGRVEFFRLEGATLTLLSDAEALATFRAR
jgi:putative lipoprotein